MKKLFLTAALGLLTAAGASAQLLINGAGATFPQPIYTKWFDEYAKVDPSVRFNYQGIGSGGGQKQILSETVDFGASDGPMSNENLAKAPRTLWHIPTVAGAVVVTYNVSGNPKLRLDGPTLAAIFLGKITRWDDPAIAGQNSGVSLPSQDILVVHRSDGSGTSFIFTDYLSHVSAEWKSKVGTNTSVDWPVGLGGRLRRRDHAGRGSESVPGRPWSSRSPAISSRTPNTIRAKARPRLGEAGRSAGTARSTISTIIVLGNCTSIFSLVIFMSRIWRKRCNSSRLRLASK